MTEKLATLWPEIIMLAGGCVSMIVGLSPRAGTRRATAFIAAATLVMAGVAVIAMAQGEAGAQTGGFALYVKMAVVAVGLLLLMVAAGVPGQLQMTRDAEAAEQKGAPFEPGNVMRGEFYAFFLFSLTGVMLCSQATDLVWLFLSLELTSLPTYVMVATSRDRIEAQESAVKYFFLGAMAAAVFLYGFTLIYGATGHTELPAIATFITANGAAPLPPLLIAGLVLSVLGIGFKIAAVPMHFYAADVYQGAHVAVTAFLAFVPKTAGFIAIILLLQLVPGDLMPLQLKIVLWIMAAATMTVGNVLGVLQANVKRVLAYSSIAHSGYMLVALTGGLAVATAGESGGIGNGAAAVLFYLVVYGLATMASFAVLGCLSGRGDEAQTYNDIAGLAKRHPLLAGVMLLSVLSLIGLPPLAGFVGKFYLLSTAVNGPGIGGAAGAAIIVLVVIAVLNSAIAAVYYLRIAAACFFGECTDPGPAPPPCHWRRVGATIAAVAALIIGVRGGALVDAARDAAKLSATETTVSTTEVADQQAD